MAAFEIRRIEPHDVTFLPLIHRILNTPCQANGQSSLIVTELLARSKDGASASIELLVAECDKILVAATLTTDHHGAFSMIFPYRMENGPSLFRKSDHSEDGLVLCAKSALHRAMKRGSQFVETLVDPNLQCMASALQSSGFQFVTDLVYLSALVPKQEDIIEHDDGLSWLDGCLDNDDAFVKALELSYVDTMDCPELNTLRTTRQALEAHRSTGASIDEGSCVALRGDTPVGVLIASPISGASTIEIVYMGVAQPARGTGVANALMGRAQRFAQRVSATNMALAVDIRNHPARRLYDRWNFQPIGIQAAWIATKDHSEPYDK